MAFCWRTGSRSTSFQWEYQEAGLKSNKLFFEGFHPLLICDEGLVTLFSECQREGQKRTVLHWKVLSKALWHPHQWAVILCATVSQTLPKAFFVNIDREAFCWRTGSKSTFFWWEYQEAEIKCTKLFFEGFHPLQIVMMDWLQGLKAFPHNGSIKMKCCKAPMPFLSSVI